MVYDISSPIASAHCLSVCSFLSPVCSFLSSSLTNPFPSCHCHNRQITHARPPRALRLQTRFTVYTTQTSPDFAHTHTADINLGCITSILFLSFLLQQLSLSLQSLASLLPSIHHPSTSSILLFLLQPPFIACSAVLNHQLLHQLRLAARTMKFINLAAMALMAGLAHGEGTSKSSKIPSTLPSSTNTSSSIAHGLKLTSY
jgi:hypothetical protein